VSHNNKVRIGLASGSDVLRPDALVDSAVAAPQQEGRVEHDLFVKPAEIPVRVPFGRVNVAVTHGESGIAAEVLVGEEQGLVASL
jgi:hypothetical protein